MIALYPEPRCEACNGDGCHDEETVCEVCDGSGVEPEPEDVEQ